MNTRIILSMLFSSVLFLASLFFSCHSSDGEITKSDSMNPPQFTASTQNPIFVAATQHPNTWDHQIVFLPEVVQYNGKYYMFYTSTADLLKNPLAIGFVVSDDGKNWTRIKDSPVLEGDGQGYNAIAVGGAKILIENDKWIMYFNARSVPGPGPGKYIGRATANKPQGPWTVDANPVLTVGDNDAWDKGFVTPSDIVKVNGKYYLYYSAGTAYAAAFGNDHRHQLGLAISNNGIHFQKYNDPATTAQQYINSDPVIRNGQPGIYDSGLAWEGTVLPTSFGFEMFYTSDPDSFTGERICYATSKDGIVWEKYNQNPIFSDLQNWISHDLVVGSVIREQEEYAMYYSGISGFFDNSIGIATGFKAE